MNLLITLLAVAPLQEARPELADTLDTAVAEFVRDHRLAGLAIGVVDDGEVIYARGFGEAARGSGQPITTKSIFHMASVSKPFTATAAMQLVEAGKLDLDAPLVEYLPYFRLAEEESRTITVRQVLTHTSGFPDVHDYEWDNPQLDEGAAERYVRSIADENMLFRPGEDVSYSNMAFDTMGDVIAKVSGVSFDDHVRANILKPLGMTSSSFIHSETPEEHHTQGHSIAFSKRITPGPCPVYPYNRRHAPSSTLNSNVEDMCRWMLANLARGELDDERILAADSYAELWSRDDDTPGIGLSWFLEDYLGRRSVGHTGSDTGFGSQVIMLPEEGLGVVAMTNTEGVRLGGIVTVALQAALGEPFEVPGPLLENEFAHRLQTEGLGVAIDFYLQARDSGDWEFSFDQLDEVCRVLLWQERNDEALEVAALNLDFHTSVGTAYARLGQALAAVGDAEGARENFAEALKLEPSNRVAKAGLEELEG